MIWVVGQRVIAEFEPELGLGLVVAVVGPRMIEVKFEASKVARKYAQASAPLRRLTLPAKQKIKTKTGAVHTIAQVKEVKGVLLYLTEEGAEVWEYDLIQLVEDESVLHRFITKRWQKPRSFDLRLEGWKVRGESLNADLRGLIGPRVSLLPHQLGIASEVSRRESPRVLLSDEVGLGKTIEAGLIYSSLKALGRANRVLVIVPEALEHQWLAEMFRRFQEMFTLVDEERLEQEELSQGASAFKLNQKIISSLPFFESNAQALQDASAEEWDLIIVDEAHRLKWSPEDPSVEWEIIKLLSEQTRGLLLLTATPKRQGLETEFGLLHLVDPHKFHDFGVFNEENKQIALVARMAQKIQSEERGSAFIKELKTHFKGDEDLISEIDNYAKGAKPELLLDKLVDRHGTGRVLIRNRRTKIKGFPERCLMPWPLKMTDPWREWLESLSADKISDSELIGVASGVEAFSRRNATGKITKKKAIVPVPLEDWFKLRTDSLLKCIQANPGDKFLLICSEGSRVRELQEWFRTQTSIKTAIFDEDLEEVERDRQAAWFADAEGAQILLASEIGGEGRNFQFCHHLYLFDIPLHPDVLEQRIGRLDRIGQKFPVQIHMPYLEDTPEEVLFHWYSSGLGLFVHPWNGALLKKEIVEDFKATAKVFLPASSEYKKRKKKLDELITRTQKFAEEVRDEEEQSKDLLVDINSFSRGRGIGLAERIQEIDKKGAAKTFLEKTFEHFGIESERLDELGRIKISTHSLSFIESFPGLASHGELLATYDRTLALSREELAFLSVEHPVVQGGLSLILEGEVGTYSAGILKLDKKLPALSGVPAYFEFLFVLQPQAPANLELERELPIQTVKCAFDLDGNLLKLPDATKSVALEPISEAMQKELVSKIRERLNKASKQAFNHASQFTEAKVKKAIAEVKERFSKEQTRLISLSRVNPLISPLEVDAHGAKSDEAVKLLKDLQPRLDAVRFVMVM